MDRPKFDIIPVTEWKAPEKVEGLDPHIITMPNVPKPIQGPGCQPRTILKGTWDHMRRKCYFDAGYKCEACGAEVGKDIEKRNLHCLEKGTEVLTVHGWKRIESVTVEDTVAGFYPDTDTIVWEHPTSTTSHFEKKIYRFCRRSGRGFSVGVSSKHRMLIQDGRTKKYSVVRAEDLSVGQWKNIPAAGKGAGEEHLSADERLLIALQADGTVQRTKNSCYCQIRVKKRDKIKRLKELAKQSSYNTHQSTYQTQKHGEYFRVSFSIPYKGKHFFDTFKTPKMSYEKAKEFIDELVKWDGWEGYRGKQHGRCYYNNNKDDVDFVQAVCVQAGLGSHVTVTHREARAFGDHISNNLKPAYNLEIKKTAFHGLTTMVKQEEDYNDDVFCISVPSTFFVARTKTGDVFVTGNCHELFDYDFVNGVATFKRCVALCEKDHVRGVHSGRMYTMYKKGNPFMTKNMVLEGAEHAFSLVHKWNVEHPDEEPLRLYATWIEFAKDKVIGEEICALIDKYNIKFYGIDGKKQAQWGDWKVVIGNKEYPTPYKDEQAWAAKMEELNHTQTTDSRNYQDPFTGGVFDEIKKVLKNP